MTAKIDTQAPDRIWIEDGDDCPYFYPESELPEVEAPVIEYVRADLAAAQTAAAVERAFREGLTYGTICKVTDQDKAWRTSQACERLGHASSADMTDRIKELEKACAEWAEVSQRSYQRAKAAEAKLAKVSAASRRTERR